MEMWSSSREIPITDAGRDRNNGAFNNSGALGYGYPLFAGAGMLEKYPELDLKVTNKGISGNKVYQLAERWDTDCPEHQTRCVEHIDRGQRPLA